MNVGIDSINLYIPHYYYPLAELAERHNVDPDKYLIGIGQEKMAVPSPDEDIVTMAANAAEPLITDAVRENLSTVILATESGIDQSKSAGVFVHKLLELNSNCRVVEMKQACYAATAALQMSCDMVRQRPNEKILILASDIARYEQDSEGECTQGAGAIAMVINANPRVLSIHPSRGLYCQDVMDFWRPNYRKTALVDGKYSIDVYIEALTEAWEDYRKNGGEVPQNLRWICFHQPFTKMANKAFKALSAHESEFNCVDADAIAYTQRYGKQVGNTYTASLYIGLLSLLDNHPEDLSGESIGLFSYGSGAVGEFFSATVMPGYKAHLNTTLRHKMFNDRQALSHDQYQAWFFNREADTDTDVYLPVNTCGQFRLSHIVGHKRGYNATTCDKAQLKQAS